MKKQWQDFLENSFFPYDIVPQLVKWLDDAIKRQDYDSVINLLDLLYEQGVMLDSDNNLCFVSDFVLKLF